MSEAELKTGVGFKEPPVKRVPRYDWADTARRCRRRPGKWFLVFEDDLTSLVVAIRAGAIKSLRPEDGFETRTANNTRGNPRKCDLYVRWVKPVVTTDEEND
jgi:hypothetical protein